MMFENPPFFLVRWGVHVGSLFGRNQEVKEILASLDSDP